MRNEPTNSDDTIDSRDVIERLEELNSEREALVDAMEEARESHVEAAHVETEEGSAEEAESFEALKAAAETLHKAAAAFREWENDYGDELKALQALNDEGENYAADWNSGAQLIRDSYFVEAMEELCKDIGDLPKDIPSYLVIDWEATAENLKVDYTSIDFDGVEYWVR